MLMATAEWRRRSVKKNTLPKRKDEKYRFQLASDIVFPTDWYGWNCHTEEVGGRTLSASRDCFALSIFAWDSCVFLSSSASSSSSLSSCASDVLHFCYFYSQQFERVLSESLKCDGKDRVQIRKKLPVQRMRRHSYADFTCNKYLDSGGTNQINFLLFFLN